MAEYIDYIPFNLEIITYLHVESVLNDSQLFGRTDCDH